MAKTLSREKKVREKYPKGRSTLYLDVKDGLFPPPVKLGARCSAWPDDEVDKVVEARIAGCTDDEIRALVKRLVEARAHT